MKQIRLLATFFACLSVCTISAEKSTTSEVKWQPEKNSLQIWEMPVEKGYQQKIEKAPWDYWAIGFGGGVNYCTDTYWLYNKPGGSYLPDFRMSFEKSMYLTDDITLAFDLSLFTPTIRLGAVVGENGRFSIGAGAWWYMWVNGFDFSNRYKVPGRGPLGLYEERHHLRSNLPVTPSISYDYRISKNSLLRITASYDQISVTPKHIRAPREIAHIPQITAEIKFTF